MSRHNDLADGNAISPTPLTIDSPTLLRPQIFDSHVLEEYACNTLEESDRALKVACRANDKFFQVLHAKAQKTNRGPQVITSSKILTSLVFTAEDVNTAGQVAQTILQVFGDLPYSDGGFSENDGTALRQIAYKAAPTTPPNKRKRLNYTREDLARACTELSLPNYCTEPYRNECPKFVLLLIACDPERVLLMSICVYHCTQFKNGRNSGQNKEYYGSWPSTAVIQAVAEHKPPLSPGVAVGINASIHHVQQVFRDNADLHPFIGDCFKVKQHVTYYHRCSSESDSNLETIATADFLSKQHSIGDEDLHVRGVSYLIAARSGPLAILKEFENQQTEVSRRFMHSTPGSMAWLEQVDNARGEMTKVTSAVLRKGHHNLVMGVVNAVALWGLEQFSKFSVDQRKLYWESLWRVCPYLVTTTIEAAFYRYVSFAEIFDESAETDQEQRRMWRTWYLSKFTWDCEQVYQHYVLQRRFLNANQTIRQRLNEFFTDGYKEFPDLLATGIETVSFRQVPMREEPWPAKDDKFLWAAKPYEPWPTIEELMGVGND